jgi:hypothetical protein
MLIRLKESLISACKLLLSLRKLTWELRDYPVVTRRQNATRDLDCTSPRFTPYGYAARILKWPLVGGGDTAQDAMRDLAANFERAVADRHRKGIPLPRPGTAVPVQFASQEQVDTQAELKDDFVRRVLCLDWAWISDESSLWDFHGSETNESFHAKIKDVYGVDVSDIESGNLALILHRIAATRS